VVRYDQDQELGRKWQSLDEGLPDDQLEQPAPQGSNLAAFARQVHNHPASLQARKKAEKKKSKKSVLPKLNNNKLS
jgi:hypothetical protein